VNESILVRLGLDTSAFKRGLRSATADVKSIKGHLDTLGLSIGAGVAWAGMNRLVDKIQEMKDVSEGFGVGTDFLQGWNASLKTSGTAAEKGQKAIELFTLKLGEAQQVGDSDGAKFFQGLNVAIKDQSGNWRENEAVLRDVINAISSENNITTQATLTADAFGKKNLEVLEVIRGGTAGIDAMTQSLRDMGTLIDEEAIANVDELGKAIKNLQGAGTFLGAKVLAPIVEWTGRFARFYGNLRDLPVTMRSVQTAMAETARQEVEAEMAEKRKEQATKRIKAIQKETDTDKRKRESEEKKAAQEMQKLEEKRLQLIEAQRDAAADLYDAQTRLKRDKENRTKFQSLEELANTDPRMLDGAHRAEQKTVWRIRELEGQAEWWRVRGNEKMAGKRFEEADALRNKLQFLPDDVARPFQALQTSIDQMSSQQGILNAMIEKGIHVTPHNGGGGKGKPK
jgi:hypothetical protein